jgi:ABC-type transport system involved in cytochrome c biogenesis ATPase subunit
MRGSTVADTDGLVTLPPTGSTAGDPRVLLTDYANSADEWVRYVVSDVLTNANRPAEATIASAYELFRQEKALDERTFPTVPQIATASTPAEKSAPLSIARLSEVHGVNALVPGSVIEPHAGLTVIYGENGTGKTGYSRIFKALANSRTADEILGNVEISTDEPQAARIDYRLGDETEVLLWQGERGLPPFTRMSIFDSRSVSFHVDDDLDYVYTPAALALFEHAIDGIRGVLKMIDADLSRLRSHSPTLLARFPRDSTAYPLIETLGAATDLSKLQALGDRDPKIGARLQALQETAAALEANTIKPQLDQAVREGRVLAEASEVARVLGAFDATVYNAAVTKRAELAADYDQFRAELFAAANLPAEPDDTWATFVAAGDAYRAHLVELAVHDEARCLYCRQELTGRSVELLTKYAAYLADKIRSDIGMVDRELGALVSPLDRITTTNVAPFLDEYTDRDDKPAYFDALRELITEVASIHVQARARVELDRVPSKLTKDPRELIATTRATNEATVTTLREQLENRTTALGTTKQKLRELTAAAEIARSWAEIERIVSDAAEADRLKLLKAALPKAQRAVTELSKTASAELINHNFDILFAEECEALRAPSLKVQFVGREGRAQRRKVLSGKHRPSKVLSEGEQKVLAMADFLAEARLAGITAPVVFDDPVSSLDHRRVREVAARVANLAGDHQVIVFTHDILFTTNLLAHFEASKRCSYFQITDESGKGHVASATGPRLDTLKAIRGRINNLIQTASAQDGEAREALVHTGYSHVRSWCEVFTEDELLKGVTRRYQANVRMTTLPDIKVDRLTQCIETITRVFDDACRYTDAHSQPLLTSGVQPTLPTLEADWKALQGCKTFYETGE